VNSRPGVEADSAVSPLRLVATVLATAFASEAAVMIALPFLFPRGLPEIAVSLLDSSLLAFIISPAVWCILIRPLQSQARRLSDLNHQLSREIAVREALETRLRHQALHDTLTGLPNRALFLKQVDRAIRRKRTSSNYRFAVLFVDLDRFKSLNDSLGHGVGDLLLIEVAQRLAGAVRPGDMVARLGGDEFAVLLDGVVEEEDAARVAQRILEQSAELFVLREPQPAGATAHRVYITASVGIVGGEPQYERAEQLLRDADLAMYRAKSVGRACFQIFDPSMHARAVEKLQTESALRQALESLVSHHCQFFLVYQPIVSLADNRLTEFEALLRWNHPGKGLVPPSEFIPVAEETGMIIPLGSWVLREACRQASYWMTEISRTSAVPDRDIAVSVNVSAKQLLQLDFVAEVEAALHAAALPPQCLKLEVVETVAMGNMQGIASVLEKLRLLGVGLSIDDFGTGYSSLSYLHRLPFTTLKIDRSFVDRLSTPGESTDIVGTITKLAHSLGLKVVAEGVETIEQKEILRALGCESFQGFLFFRPLSTEDARRLLVQACREIGASCIR
jgi:diguanylate cyclase (GGDEF)-like protein